MSTMIHRSNSVLMALCSSTVLLRSHPWQGKGSRELWCHPALPSALQVPRAEGQLSLEHPIAPELAQTAPKDIPVPHHGLSPTSRAILYTFQTFSREWDWAKPLAASRFAHSIDCSGDEWEQFFWKGSFSTVKSEKVKCIATGEYQLKGEQMQPGMTETGMHRALGSATAISDGTRGLLSLPQSRDSSSGEMERAQLYSLTALIPDRWHWESCRFYFQGPGPQPLSLAQQRWH